jgi:hypothetical protein
MLQKYDDSVFTVQQYNIKNGACLVNDEMSFPYEKGNPKHKTKTNKQQRNPLRPPLQLIDVSVYSSSSLEKQPSNGEESCTAILVDNFSSTAPNSLYSFHLPINEGDQKITGI